MTQQTTTFCDFCLMEIPPAKPGECFTSMISVDAYGSVGPTFQGSNKKDFHDLKCLLGFLEEAASHRDAHNDIA